MSVVTKRKIFYFIWLVLILCGPITIFRNTPFSLIFSNNLILLNVLQRLTATLAFSALFIQIVIGSKMYNFSQIIGARAYRFHISQGLIIYGLALVHPFFESFIVYVNSKNLVKAIITVIPFVSNQRDFLLLFGKIGLYVLTVGVFTAYFRTKPFFRINWRLFHYLNYIVFYIISYHAMVGSDIRTQPFQAIYWFAIFTVTAILIQKIILFSKLNLLKSFQKK